MKAVLIVLSLAVSAGPARAEEIPLAERAKDACDWAAVSYQETCVKSWMERAEEKLARGREVKDLVRQYCSEQSTRDLADCLEDPWKDRGVAKPLEEWEERALKDEEQRFQPSFRRAKRVCGEWDSAKEPLERWMGCVKAEEEKQRQDYVVEWKAERATFGQLALGQELLACLRKYGTEDLGKCRRWEAKANEKTPMEELENEVEELRAEVERLKGRVE